MSKITIRTLAKQLGISISTVSKALKDSYEISNETKKKVLDLAAALDYIPNPYASSLRKQKSKTIAVVLPEVADNFFSLAINGIQSVASAKKYHVLIYLSHESFAIEKEILNQCTSGRVDGVLISVSNETKTTDHIDKIKKESIPLVFFDRAFENYPSPKVVTNDYECGRLAAMHLIEKGCQNPIYLSCSKDLTICKSRSDGFMDVLREHGLSTDKPIHFEISCNENDNTTMKQLKNILKENPRIDAVVASVEKFALQTYLICQEQNIAIPQSLKVIAFSTLQTAPILNPSLTTISQPAFDIGKNAAEILFGLIDQKRHAVSNDFTMVLPSSLIERNSTK